MTPADDSLKDKAVSFLRLASAGQIREAYERYVDPTFRHHNVFFRGDRESLMKAMEEDALKSPNKILDIKLALQEGSYVALHSHVRQRAQDRGFALVHIFRFEGDRIVELWDLAQAIPQDSPNQHGMF